MSETVFTTLAVRDQLMLTTANVPMAERFSLFQEVTNHTTNVDWLTIVKVDDVKRSRIEHFKMKLPMWTNNLWIWGEAGNVKTDEDEKLGDRGMTRIFVGFANNHCPDVFRMLNPETR